MQREHEKLESRVERLAADLARLEVRVEEIAQALWQPGGAAAPNPAAITAVPRDASVATASSFNANQLFSAAATVSFLLAVALILRTLAEAAVIPLGLGPVLGIAYGAALIGYGHYRYSKAHRLIPVYASCGSLLIYTIVFETHVFFGTMSTHVAYGILFLTLIATAALGVRHRVPALIALGVLGAAFVGIVLDFPAWHTVDLALLLFAANIAAYRAAKNERWRWLLWGVFLLTLFFWLGWSIRINAWLARGAVETASLRAGWFLPLLLLFLALYHFFPLWSARRAGRKFGWFESIVPLLSAAAAFLAMAQFLPSIYGSTLPAGAAACLMSAVTVLAACLARGNHSEKKAHAAYGMSALFLLFAGTSYLLPNFSISLLLWTLIAWNTVILATYLENNVLRIASIVGQAVTFAACASAGLLLTSTVDGLLTIGLLVLLALACWMHYYWCRRNPVVAEGWISRLDTQDWAPLLLLVFALFYAFGAARIGAQMALDSFGLTVASHNHCVQSIIINLGAIFLTLLGSQREKTEIWRIGAAVALIGAVKVFAFDLTHCHGLPLVLSVLSFGVAALTVSLTWSRNARQTNTAGENS